jgi:fumarate reductase subunit C
MKDKSMIKKIFAHLTIVITVMMAVLLVIDSVNDAMGFLRGPEFKTLLIIYCVVALLTAVFYITSAPKKHGRYVRVAKKRTHAVDNSSYENEY